MNCPKCSTSNADPRKFCRECGALIVTYCPRCGFSNTPNDKFCGGCGINLADMSVPAQQCGRQGETAMVPGKYSYEDITELVQGQTQKKVPGQKKKEMKTTDSVSQDLLDSMFDSTDSD